MSRGLHLDEDRLSALMDGEADDADVEHAAACPECSARAAAWRDARRLVATAVPAAPAAQRDAAVAAALAVAGEPAAAMVSLDERRVRRARRARAVLAVAAAVVVVGVVGAVVHAGGSGSGSNSGTRSAAGSVATTGEGSTTPGVGQSSGAQSPGAQPVVHLGAVQGPGPLAGELRSALGATPAAGASTPAAAPGATRTIAPNAVSPPGTTAGPSDRAVTACLGPATADAHLPAESSPRLEATLTYQGLPAAAYVFDQGSQREAVVVAELGCRLLADVAL
jgi:hypothetical protein